VVKAPKYSYATPILISLHWLKINERIKYKLLSLANKVLTTSQPDNLISVQSLMVQSTGRTHSSSVVNLSPSLDHPPYYKSPTALSDMHHLTCGIELPSSFRQPHSVHCPPGSPHPARITSSATTCIFALTIYHSHDLSLKTNLFHTSFPP